VTDVSVVIPARNEERYIERALQSIAEQKFPMAELEVVVVDNGSVDDTVSIVRLFAKNHSELNLSLVAEEVPGVARAKNSGAKAARGSVLVFVDADSRMEPGLMTSIVNGQGLGSPAGSIRVSADSRNLIDRAFFGLMEFGKVRFGIRSQMLYCDSQLFRELGGFNPALRLGEDLDFLRRLRGRLKETGGTLTHVRNSGILTSPRRLQRWPLRLGIIPMFWRWLLAFLGFGRGRDY
jgi:glycosyltransferase involved in cell wall biosynthesis